MKEIELAGIDYQISLPEFDCSLLMDYMTTWKSNFDRFGDYVSGGVKLYASFYKEDEPNVEFRCYGSIEDNQYQMGIRPRKSIGGYEAETETWFDKSILNGKRLQLVDFGDTENGRHSSLAPIMLHEFENGLRVFCKEQISELNVLNYNDEILLNKNLGRRRR
jgi:hypothetical protein